MQLKVQLKSHTTFIAVSLILTYVLSWVSEEVMGYFVMNLSKVVTGLQIWRIITCPYCVLHILEMILLLLIFIPLGNIREQQTTTRRYVPYFIMGNLIGQGFYFLLEGIYNVIVGQDFMTSTLHSGISGLWVIMFCDLTLKSLEWDRIKPGMQYTPAAWILLVSLLRFQLSFDCVAGWILGLIHNEGLLKWTYIFDGPEDIFQLIQMSPRHRNISFDNRDFEAIDKDDDEEDANTA